MTGDEHMNFTALKFEPHSILKAYAVLFGEMPGTMFFLDRKRLKTQWEQRARVLNDAQNVGWQQQVTAREDTLELEELDWAYRSLLEVLDGRDQALVSGWACETIDAVNAVLKRSRYLKPSAARPSAAGRPSTLGRRQTVKAGRMASTARVKAVGSTAEVVRLPRVAGDAPGPRPRPMFGRFLLARGHITLQQLIDAVRWQRAQRPPVGRIAMSWGILSAKQVYDVLAEKEPDDRFCDVAVKKGYMTGIQRLAVLGRQREMQEPIGTYFVEQGILTRDEIEGLAAEAKDQ